MKKLNRIKIEEMPGFLDSFHVTCYKLVSHDGKTLYLYIVEIASGSAEEGSLYNYYIAKELYLPRVVFALGLNINGKESIRYYV